MELQCKPRSKEIRKRAWEALGAGSYWPYVGDTLLLGIISGFAVVVPMMIFIVCTIVFAVSGGVISEQSVTVPETLPPVILADILIGSCILAIPITYITGFAAWGSGSMALAAADRRFKFGFCVSGWGHGWRMAWTVMVQWTYLTLWYFLLIIPGILKTFSYAMTKYVQIEHPDWCANRCIEESMRLMRGNRWRLFKLGISFIGWYLLMLPMALFGFSGVAMLFLSPYPLTAFACFYRQLLVEKGPPLAV